MRAIRKATEKDLLLIQKLAHAIWPAAYEKIISMAQINYMLDLMYSESALQKQMEDGCQFLIIQEDNTPLGFASYQEVKPRGFKLHKLYVLPSQQGKGAGKALIDYILDTIRPQLALSLELQVNKNNPAFHFYKKLGFEIKEEMVLDIGNGFVMDDYIMYKELRAKS